MININQYHILLSKLADKCDAEIYKLADKCAEIDAEIYKLEIESFRVRTEFWEEIVIVNQQMLLNVCLKLKDFSNKYYLICEEHWR